MRYIGNKTRLLPFIRRTLTRLGIEKGVAHDAFAGTAAVGRALTLDGWKVVSSDLMTYSYVFQQAYVVARRPRVGTLVAADPAVKHALQTRKAEAARAPEAAALLALGEYLATDIADETGLITREFSPMGGRMYFTEANARRIDAARATIERWRRGGLVSADVYYVLLASVLEGADRVANTAGVYAAYIKQWQPNALRPFRMVPELPVNGAPRGRAFRDDAVAVARRLKGIHLLYVDPPYNSRQYAGYYHVPEVIARGWFGGEPMVLRGKTGLIGDASLRSDWCSRKRAPTALRALLAATSAKHVLVSYNSEGVLTERNLREILGEAAVDGRVRRFARRYRRYRADRDHAGRRYRTDLIREFLFYVCLR